MLENAIAKIKAEMDANKDNSYVQVVGQFLLHRLGAFPECADKILAEDKTLAKSLDAMQAEARKKSKGTVTVLTDEEGFAIVLKYFGITGSAARVNAGVAPAAHAAPTVEPVSAAASWHASGFDVKLDDFL